MINSNINSNSTTNSNVNSSSTTDCILNDPNQLVLKNGTVTINPCHIIYAIITEINPGWCIDIYIEDTHSLQDKVIHITYDDEVEAKDDYDIVTKYMSYMNRLYPPTRIIGVGDDRKPLFEPFYFHPNETTPKSPFEPPFEVTC